MRPIDADKLIKHLNACLAESDGGTPITDAVIVAIRSAVENMPSVDAVPVVRYGECRHNVGETTDKNREKSGTWTERIDEDEEDIFRRKFFCSCCGDWNTYGKTKFCPECGAKMENAE